jgi:hypothetical protein
MKESIKQELNSHLLDLINDGVLTNENTDDWHFHAFNEDHYLIGYFECSEWLKGHGVGEFESVAIVKEYEEEMFGEMNTDINSEAIVNMLAYIYGEEILNTINAETVEELKEELTD